jgi:hypothetical protein
VPDMTQRESSAAPIYRGMDRVTLDAAYNNSAAVADSAGRLADWHRRSMAIRATPGALLDVPYGAQQRSRLDYLPAGPPARRFSCLSMAVIGNETAKTSFPSWRRVRAHTALMS